jgi:hypothetical protein
MSYDLAPLKSYVRFYLAIRSQLERVWQSLCAIEAALRDELGPFAADLAPVGLPALTTLVDAPRNAPADLAALWSPEDDAELTGLTDVYEVVGRFSFQGDLDENLARIARLVADGQDAVVENADALRGLAVLDARARDTAERLREEEAARAGAVRVARAAELEALAEKVLELARRTDEAVESVPLATFDNAAEAAEDYRRLRARMQQVYWTCLRYLKDAIAQLWDRIGDPVPQSFPDELPLVPELPPELVAVTAAGSEEVERAERTLAALAEESERLVRTKQDITARLAKLEGEATAIGVKRAEAAADLESAQKLHDWARLGEQLAGHKTRADELENELRSRLALSGQQAADLAAVRARLDEQAKTIAEREAALAAMTAETEELRKKEPLLFGKDEWRARLAEADAKLEGERASVAELTQAHAQHKVAFSAVEVRLDTARAEQAILERSLADVRARRVEAEKGFAALGAELGSKRPTRLVPAGEVEDIVHALEQRQLEVDGSLERLRGEQKRLRDDGLAVLAREKQIDSERQSAQARVASARVSRAEGLEAAQQRLAVERKNAVEEHVREVRAALSKSLAQVGTVFIEPARARLRELTEPDYARAERVKAAGEAAAPIVERLIAERAPELVEVDKLLTRIKQEFVEAAPAACRAAWG